MEYHFEADLFSTAYLIFAFFFPQVIQRCEEASACPERVFHTMNKPYSYAWLF